MPQAVTHLITAQDVQDPTIATFQQFNCLVGKKKICKEFFWSFVNLNLLKRKFSLQHKDDIPLHSMIEKIK